ncbi:MAG: hypothetical protein DHS20C11_38200 [Lysobacteraceae bacterium]|nr:MAG: hypothetical protein DHS20C11_38200 [Xanthomonadaceae bacterium]
MTRGTPWLAVLMVASLALLATLVWQSIVSARNHLAAAEQVLEDYSRLAADEYIRRLKGAIGYWALYQSGQQLQGDVEGFEQRALQFMQRAPGDLDPRQAMAIAAIASVFEFDRAAASINAVVGRLDDGLMAELLNADQVPTASEPFRVYHWNDGQQHRTTVLYANEAGLEWGIDLKPRDFSVWFEQVFGQAPLLPASIAGDIGNAPIHLQLQTPDGDILFQSEAGFDPYLSTTTMVDDDYGGLFAGFTVITSIDPDRAPELVIGGLPRSRLPWLLLLVLLTVLVMASTIRLVMRDRALSRMRSDFVARVSHELRTPLTQIRMFAETLLLGRAKDQQQQHNYHAIINREALRLGHLVDNLLAFSGKERAPQSLVIESVPLDQLLVEIGHAYAPLLEARGDQLRLEIPDPVRGMADREAFRQIVLNLLDNACKYGPSGQTITLGLWRDGDQACLAVDDQGPGVPIGDRHRVWQSYQRLSRDNDRAIAGTGIGLAVARELIDAMGGSYRIESAAGGGARFVVCLPAC